MNNLKTNISFKVGMIVLVIFLLLIPAAMIQGLIHEREKTQAEAIEEISQKWATSQTISGPFLTIPYGKIIQDTISTDSIVMTAHVQGNVHVLPEELTINADITPEKRYRGLYEVVVYESALQLSGSFPPINVSQLALDSKDILFEKATINFGIPDLKGIEKQIDIQWNQDTLHFDSGITTQDVVSSGIHAPIDLQDIHQKTNTFSSSIELKGSQHLYFMPLGKTTDVNLTSNWPTPSFNGEYLPDNREVNEHGFTANWNILHLNRNYPQIWTNAKYQIEESAFGTNLLLPVDNYKKSNRVVKYAILFLGLTFMVFFLVEVFNQVFIHPIQYLLVGIALVVFYTLLLAFSEHIAFNLAYVLSTGLTLSLITLYSWAIFKSKQLALLVLGILLVMYTFVFAIIQLEDYALLIGSIGIFLILALVMFYSRSINWYNITLTDQINIPENRES